MTHMGVPVGRSLVIGVCQELFFERLDPEVRQLVESAVPMLGEVREVRIPHVRLAGAVQALITSPEAGAFHDRWLAQRPDEYHWSVRNRLEAAREVGACDYVQATRLRGLLAQEMSAALADVDVLAMPTVAVPAPRFGQREIRLEDGVAEPVGPLMLRNAAPMNVTGFPAITVPCGMTTDGLPVGLQFVARPWEEGLLLGVARAFEVRFARE
jgi:aspartyl-tRNA(Asn)/glutamyl-tRNA(Gln) amidotransferase subunit A